MRERYRGQMIRKFGLICGPHPDKCGCCRTMAYTQFKRAQRRAKRAMGKRECAAIMREESLYDAMEREETDNFNEAIAQYEAMIQLERLYALAFPYRYQFDPMV